jgi:putative Ca2+/H+ antiporter (TMEM165/GDT1 family)
MRTAVPARVVIGFLIREYPEVLPDISAFFVSASALGFAELGDKTQFLALTLAARYRKPVPIILGILAATFLNNAGVAAVGQWVTEHIGADVLRWVVGVSLLAMAAWMLVPEKKEAGSARVRVDAFGVFFASLISFFLAELADKTQIATMALAARYAHSYWAVVLGSVCGMMAVNIPAVLIGEKATKILPMRTVHIVAASIYALVGVLTLLNHTSSLPMSPAA